MRALLAAACLAWIALAPVAAAQYGGGDAPAPAPATPTDTTPGDDKTPALATRPAIFGPARGARARPGPPPRASTLPARLRGGAARWPARPAAHPRRRAARPRRGRGTWRPGGRPALPRDAPGSPRARRPWEAAAAAPRARRTRGSRTRPSPPASAARGRTPLVVAFSFRFGTRGNEERPRLLPPLFFTTRTTKGHEGPLFLTELWSLVAPRGPRCEAGARGRIQEGSGWWCASCPSRSTA
jgi:hypothetical protein